MSHTEFHVMSLESMFYLLTLRHISSQRLFDKNVQSPFSSTNDALFVKEIRKGNYDGVKIRAIQQISIIMI